MFWLIKFAYLHTGKCIISFLQKSQLVCVLGFKGVFSVLAISRRSHSSFVSKPLYVHTGINILLWVRSRGTSTFLSGCLCQSGGLQSSAEALHLLKWVFFNGISSQKWATSRYFPKKQEPGPTSPPRWWRPWLGVSRWQDCQIYGSGIFKLDLLDTTYDITMLVFSDQTHSWLATRKRLDGTQVLQCNYSAHCPASKIQQSKNFEEDCSTLHQPSSWYYQVREKL